MTRPNAWPAGWTPPATTPGPVPSALKGPAQGPANQIALWRRRWAPPGMPATPAIAGLVFAAAVVIAISVPFATGIGWAIAALAGIGAVMASRHVRARPTGPAPLVERREPLRWDRWFWGAATFALLTVGTFRAAGWLFLLCLFVAAVTGTLALIGGSSLRAIVVAGTMPPLAALRSIRWLGAGFLRLRPAKRPATSAGSSRIRVLGTAAVSVVLLVVFGALLASADPAFGRALVALVPALDPVAAVRWALVFGVAMLVIGACVYLRASSPDLSGVDRQSPRKVNRSEWAVPLGLLTLLFAGFVAVRLTELFGGDDHVRSTDGLTYAAYARGGFWQLCIVTVLTLAVLAGAAYWAPRATAADRTLIRAILGTLTVLTLVIVASALSGMTTYIHTYGLTRMRLLVTCCEAWFGLVLVMVLVAGLRLSASWLPRTAIAAGVLSLIALSVANPDRLIAENNLHRTHHGVDLMYLSSLSADAVPALLGLDPAERGCVLSQLRADLQSDPATWQTWNLSRHNAEILLQDYRAARPGLATC